MARSARSSKLEDRSNRLKLPVAKKPLFVKIGVGTHLGYRRNQNGTPGTWVLRLLRSVDGKKLDQTERLAIADDYEKADGDAVLDYWEAQDRARARARARADGGFSSAKPETVAEALTAYVGDLTTRGGDVGNVSRVRKHLAAAIADKLVADLDERALRRWRDALAKVLAPATVNRTTTALKAALNRAADLDKRIINRRPWEIGLRALAGAEQSRNVILDDATVLALVDAAIGEGNEFGLLVGVAAFTGARYSQIARLACGDLQTGAAPRLMMPLSDKGKVGAKTKNGRRPVPITASLARQLAQRATGRPANAPLLTKSSGDPWRKSDHSRLFARAAIRCGLDPKQVTIYALRHSSIVRAIKANVPIRIIATGHDTSVAMIERHYSAQISDFADELSRRALLDPERDSRGRIVQHEPRPAAIAEAVAQ